MAGLLDLLKPQQVGGLLGSADNRTLLGLQMLANSGPSLTPRSGFEGLPELAAGMQQRAQQQRLIDEEKQRQAQLSSALVNAMPGLNPQLAQADPDMALRVFQAQQPKQKDQPSSVQEYQFAVSQGFPGTYQDWVTDQNKSKATNVTVGGGRYGTIPTGYMLQEGAQGATLVPIPGGPAEAEKIAAERAKNTQGERTSSAANVVFEDIGRARQIVKNAPFYNPALGPSGALARGVPGSNAADLQALTDTIVANIGFDRLEAMRQSSPTGGALGAVTERELALLQATAGSLSLSQSEQQFNQNLDRLETMYKRIIDKFSAYPGATQARGAQSAPVGDDINALIDMYAR